jgi:hypothetical protein
MHGIAHPNKIKTVLNFGIDEILQMTKISSAQPENDDEFALEVIGVQEFNKFHELFLGGVWADFQAERVGNPAE